MQKLLVTGASGFLGWHLCVIAQSEWVVHGCYRSRKLLPKAVCPHPIDLTDYKALKVLFRELRPKAVIHSAGIRDVEFCQTHKSQSHAVNVRASENIAGLCADSGALCLFVSSDLVFDGLKPPYREEDEVCPVNVYGTHKATAEKQLIRRYPQAVICRLPLIYGPARPFGESFIQPLMRAIKAKAPLTLFSDEFRTPISAGDAAVGLLLALERQPGILHIGGPQRVSRFEFGRLLAEILDAGDAKITPSRRCEADLQAPRPADVSLDITKAHMLGFSPAPLREGLRWAASDVAFKMLRRKGETRWRYPYTTRP
ncbi:MAG: SDR family oxidoreductase [Desulfobacteraceae bacterium]|nr:MAG: SDR family oxidoreductase [Desulfobacteraceae bacterium]